MVYTQAVSQEMVVQISVYILKGFSQRSQPSGIYI